MPAASTLCSSSPCSAPYQRGPGRPNGFRTGVETGLRRQYEQLAGTYDSRMQQPMGDPEVSTVGTRATPADPGRGDGRHRPRMADVASVAGVSHQTVSRVLN